MVLDLIGILKNVGAEKKFEDEPVFGKVSFAGAVYNFDKPVKITGRVKNIGGAVKLSAHVCGSAVTPCDRCGTDVTIEVDYDIEENISSDSQDGDCIVPDGTEIDVTAVALENFFSNVNMKCLCRPDCKGLCQHCGVDRNVTECRCEENNIDPRMSALDELF